MNISQTQILLYRDCPYAYALQYKYKKQRIMYDPTIMDVGSLVHKVIDKYYKNAYNSKTTEADILAKVYFLLRREWDTTLSNELFKKAYVCLENFAKYEMANINRGIRSKPTTELKLMSYGLMGIIDTFNQKAGKAGDFKTNTKATLSYNYKVQAAMYKYLLERETNKSIISLDFIFLYPNEIKQVRFSKNTDKILDDILYYKDCILASWKKDKFDKSPRTKNMCKYCPFKYYCGGVKW